MLQVLQSTRVQCYKCYNLSELNVTSVTIYQSSMLQVVQSTRAQCYKWYNLPELNVISGTIYQLNVTSVFSLYPVKK